MHHEFHTVEIKNITRETPDCISVEFDIPESLKSNLEYKAGQYLTIRTAVNGDTLQRPYSICSAPHEQKWKIAIKKASQGVFSQFALKNFKAGLSIDVMGPEGNFTLDTDPGQENKYVFFAAGSGITPIISLIKDILENEPKSNIQLFFGNKKFSSIIFYAELQKLKNASEGRLDIQYFFTEEPMKDELFCGRLDVSKCTLLARKMILNIPETDDFFLCGPEKMIIDLREMFIEHGVSKEKIHLELFESEAGNKLKFKEKSEEPVNSDVSIVTVTLDGQDHTIEVPYDDLPILEYVLDEGLPAPFSCLGGVCCSCRAKLLEGEVEMMANFALDDDEVEEGYRLTCQSLPKSPKIHLDYDQ